MIISSGGIMLVSFLMGLNHIGNIQAAVQASIPNLLLANNVFGGNAGIILSLLFAIIILAAIFSTICPMLWTCASMLAKDDKSKKYKLICVIAGICVYIITLFVPYETLLNYIMTYCGYSGCVVAVVCIVRYFIIKSRDTKEAKVMKKEHRNKMIAPIIIAAVLIVYYVAIAAVFMLIPDLTVIMKLLMVIIPLALAGVAFAVTVERVQEIRSGEEDDLSKY